MIYSGKKPRTPEHAPSVDQRWSRTCAICGPKAVKRPKYLSQVHKLTQEERAGLLMKAKEVPQSLLNRVTATKEMKKVDTDRLHDHAIEWKVWTKRGGVTKCTSRGYWTWQEKI